jgi:hypothetical protein
MYKEGPVLRIIMQELNFIRNEMPTKIQGFGHKIKIYKQEFLPKTSSSTVAFLCPCQTKTSVQSTSNTDKIE